VRDHRSSATPAAAHLLQEDDLVTHFEFDLGMGQQSQFLPDALWDGDLSPGCDLHR
jgi:hypothetical protein